MLETGLPQDMFDVPSVDMDFHIAPSLGLDFKSVVLAFLPHELDDLTKLVERLPRAAFLGVAEREQFNGFVEALSRYQEFADVRRVSTAVALLTRVAHAEVDRIEAEREAEEKAEKQGVEPEKPPADDAKTDAARGAGDNPVDENGPNGSEGSHSGN